MNTVGIISGAALIIIIAVWHKLVVWGEYFLGKKLCAALFSVLGAACIALSLMCADSLASVILAIAGFSSLWGIKETIEQEKRVKNGWFPKKSKELKNTGKSEADGN